MTSSGAGDENANSVTRQPCALQDFMDYLVYVSHDAENLQFWLWLQDYTQRFYSSPRSEQAQSPLWFDMGASQLDVSTVDEPSPTVERSQNGSEFEANVDHAEYPISPVSSTQFDKQSFSTQFDKQSFVSRITNHTVADSVDEAAQSGRKSPGCMYSIVFQWDLGSGAKRGP